MTTNKKNNSSGWSRRQFLGSSALGITGGLAGGIGGTLPASATGNETAKHSTPPSLKRILEESFYARKDISFDINDCAETRWRNKKVEDFRTLYSAGDTEHVRVTGRATMDVSSEITHQGKNCVVLTTSLKVEGVQPWSGARFDVSFDTVDLSAYNRISLWVYLEVAGLQNLYLPVSFGNSGKAVSHYPSLIPNTWNHLTFEVADVERDAVQRMGITAHFPGCPPEAVPTMKLYLGDIRAEKVEADDDLGWELKDRIAFCHSGYLPGMKKIALAQNIKDKKFSLCNLENRVVFENQVREVAHDSGMFHELDFSDYNTPGEYFLKVDQRRTRPFWIDGQALDSSIWKSINFMRQLRCGEDVPGVHSACHLNSRTVHPATQASVPNFGGWHDAGDLSQFEIPTAEIAQSMLELAIRVKDRDKMLYERLLEEGKVGIAWLQRTRFGDGFRALRVSYRRWLDNVLQHDDDTVRQNPAENGPFENFLASCACAVAARAYQEVDPVFADWCLRSAEEDFLFAKDGYEKGIFTVRWGSNVDSQVCGAGAFAAAELYALTGKAEYATIGAALAKTILACQKSDYPNWKIPIRGFFYENPAHTKTLTYEHRGHEQSPLQGLARLYELIPHHPDRPQWKAGLELYREYVQKTCELAYLYNLLPAHVYELDKLNMERFTIPSSFGTLEWANGELQEQIKTGIKLGENAYLRVLPVAIQRRGYHATLLSKAKAVSIVGRALHDKNLLQVAMDQIEWVLGKNPFASSTMYGEGHNYHPLYVAFSRQIVGSLPVGIQTRGREDLPYWPTINGYVYKEIWGHTTGKYLFVLADLV